MTKRTLPHFARNRYLIMLILALGLGGCNNKNSLNETPEQVAISTVTAVDSLYNTVLSFSGTVSPNKEANLGSVVPGKVEQILVPEGGTVEAGELIAVMSDEFLSQSEIEYQAVKKDFERMQTLLAKNSVSQQEYDHIKALYDAANLKLQMARKNTEIRAPFSGVVMKHLVQEGENYFFYPNLSPGMSISSGIISLMQIDPILIKINVNEKNLNQIRIGQSATIKTDALKGATFTGKIIKISPLLSTISHSAEVDISVMNGDYKLKPGMSCYVELQLPARKGIMIPKFALLQQAGTKDQYVYLIKNNTARRKVVNVLSYCGDWAVVDNLAAGQIVALDGKNKLSDGSQVVISGEK
ncbi:MAG: efflux RND transporter periplasmic adaptor subunit [Candidatus Cloacimonas sp.]